MQEKRGRRILAINHDKRVVGMVSIGDTTWALTEFAGKTLRKLSAIGDEPKRPTAHRLASRAL